MAETLLTAVNKSMKRVNLIDAGGELTSFTDTETQHFIDVQLMLWQEALDHVLAEGDWPEETAEGTITLVDGDRDYAVAADFKKFAGDTMVDKTNGNWLLPYPGGFEKIFQDQVQPANYTGLPIHWTIDLDGEIYTDFIPQSTEAGRIYTYLYAKEVTVTLTTDTFPFSDAAVRAMVPMVAELYRRDQRKEFDAALFQASLARAMKHIRREAKTKKW